MKVTCTAAENAAPVPPAETLYVYPPGTPVWVNSDGRNAFGMIAAWRVMGDAGNGLRLCYDVYVLDHRGEGLVVEAGGGQVSASATPGSRLQVSVARPG